MSVTLYYFSGTGNSLHVAKEIQKRVPDSKLISMISHLDSYVLEADSRIIGFVFPLYFTTIPVPVRQFIEKLNMDSVEYVFSVLTRYGTFSVAHENVTRILKSKGKKLDAQFMLKMANNSPTGLKPGKGDRNWTKKISGDNFAKLENELIPKLELISNIVKEQKSYPEKILPNPFISILERLMYWLTANNKTEIGYYTDESCEGCGKCEKVCPSGKIKMANKKPHWQKNKRCYYCYACFNFCPTQSILVRHKYEQKNGRYFHPKISVDDIARQKKIL